MNSPLFVAIVGSMGTVTLIFSGALFFIPCKPKILPAEFAAYNSFFRVRIGSAFFAGDILQISDHLYCAVYCIITGINSAKRVFFSYRSFNG